MKMQKRYFFPMMTAFLLLCVFSLISVPAFAASQHVSGTIYASALADNAELVLDGDTILVMDTERSLKNISGDYALTIQGDKKLSMTYAGRLINVASVTISAPIDALGGNTTAIYAKSGSVVINSDVNVEAVSGIWAKKNITFNSGTAWIEAGLIAIKAEEGTITIRSTVSAYSNDSDVINAYRDVIIESPAQVTAHATKGKNAIRSRYGNITITGNIVSTQGYRGIYADNGNITLGGTVLAVSGNSPAIYAPNGSITVESGRTVAEGVNGIWAKNNVTVNGGSVTVNGSISGIVAETGSISISGDVTAYSFDEATVRAAGNIIIHSGYLDISNSGHSCIYTSNGSIRMESGTLKAATGAYGLNAKNGDIEINGVADIETGSHPGINVQNGSAVLKGKITIKSKTTAVWAKNMVTFASGCTVQAEGNTRAVYSDSGQFTIQYPLAIILPTQGTVNGKTIVDADDQTATFAYISTPIYSIEFDANGGDGVMSLVHVARGGTYTLPACKFTPPEGKRFRTWNLGAPGASITINQNYLVKPIWEDDLYQVSFSPGAGTGSLNSVNVLYGNNYLVGSPGTAFTPPSGKTFSHWQVSTGGIAHPGNHIVITQDTVLTAYWVQEVTSPELCEITFDANGGTGSQGSVWVRSGGVYQLGANPFTPPVGKKFYYWHASTLNDYYSPGDRIVITGNTVLKAIWDAPEHTVNFVANGHGTAPSSISVPEGKDLWRYRPDDPVAEGYYFECWYTEPACIHLFNFNTEKMPNRDITLYANWIPLVREVRIEGFRTPGIGQYATMLDDLSIPADAHYTITKITWSDGDTYQTVEQPFKFEAGKRYYAQIDLYVEDGWAFNPVDMPMVPTPDILPCDFDVFTLNGDDVIDLVVTGSNYHCYLQTDYLTPAVVIEEGQCGDNLHYSLNFATGWVTITGSGAMWDYDNSSNTSPFSGRSEITRLIIEDGATSIGSSAFNRCNNLVSVYMADSVKAIGNDTFSASSKLNYISFSDQLTSIGEEAFYGCYGLTQVDLPNGLTSIGNYAFHATELKDVTLPASVTSLGNQAFSTCYSLERVTALNKAMTFGSYVFLDSSVTLYGYRGSTAKSYSDSYGTPFVPLDPAPDFYLPSGLTTIEAEAFEDIAATAVVIPRYVTAIEGDPFSGSSVTIIYAYDENWKSWAEDNGYTFMLIE